MKFRSLAGTQTIAPQTIITTPNLTNTIGFTFPDWKNGKAFSSQGKVHE